MMQAQRTTASAMHCLLPFVQRLQQHISPAWLAAQQQHNSASLALTASSETGSCSDTLLQQELPQRQRQRSAAAEAAALQIMSSLHSAVQHTLLGHSRSSYLQHSCQASRCCHSSSTAVAGCSACTNSDDMRGMGHTRGNSLQVYGSAAAVAAAAAPSRAVRCLSSATAEHGWDLNASRMHSSSGTKAGLISSCSSRSSEYVLDDIHSTTAEAITSGNLPDWSSSSSSHRGKVVAVAVSGGVDSAVSALLLKRLGYKVFGVYMHNWDASDEAGSCAPTCTSAADLEDAKQVCAALGMPLYEADFVSQYWNSVFAAFLEGLERGLTPNPDLACNSHIKFGALLRFAQQKGADVLATGHYARVAWRDAEDAAPAAAGGAAAGASDVQQQQHQQQQRRQPRRRQPVLLAGADPLKDQTYFLAGLSQQQLACVMFPVGHLNKADVRRIAAAAQLPMAGKRSSAGICFIGRRSFGRFLEDYLAPKPGVYVDLDTGRQLGSCSNMLAVTVGQRAIGLGGQQERVYVAGKEMASGVVLVARGREHPALYSSSVLLLPPNWTSNAPPTAAAELGAAAGSVCSSSSSSSSSSGGLLQCSYRARYRQPAAACSIRPLLPGEQFAVSRSCGSWQEATATMNVVLQEAQVHAEKAAAAAAGNGSRRPAAAGPAAAMQQQQGSGQQGLWVAELAEPLRGITPGQMFVLYDGQVCLGGAMIAAHGPTMAEQQ